MHLLQHGRRLSMGAAVHVHVIQGPPLQSESPAAESRGCFNICTWWWGIGWRVCEAAALSGRPSFGQPCQGGGERSRAHGVCVALLPHRPLPWHTQCAMAVHAHAARLCGSFCVAGGVTGAEDWPRVCARLVEIVLLCVMGWAKTFGGGRCVTCFQFLYPHAHRCCG